VRQGAQPAAATTDRDFLRQVAQGGHAEVELAKLAQQKAQSPAVKQFAQRLEQDHGKVNQEVESLATQKDIQLATAPSPDQAALKARLEKLQGAEFDKVFMSAMVTNHKKSITSFEQRAASGSDADVKAFASKTLPALREHLKLSQDIQATLGTSN
jgi:putative membrane protein